MKWKAWKVPVDEDEQRIRWKGVWVHSATEDENDHRRQCFHVGGGAFGSARYS